MRSDHTNETPEAQLDFSGGMVMVGEVPANGYRYARNVVVERGALATRPSIRQGYKIPLAGFNEYFYFNEENARVNDADHTGFWFPWRFAGSAFIAIRGLGIYKPSWLPRSMQVVVADGRVYSLEAGVATVIPTAEDLGDETVNLVQAADELVMFRSGDKNPLRWDGTSTGFRSFTEPGTVNRIPKGTDGLYVGNRLLVVKDSTIFASDILDIDSYEFVGQQFDINSGDGEDIVRVIEFNKDTLLVFKRHSVHAIYGINSFVDTVAQETLASKLDIQCLSSFYGLAARHGVVMHGNQVSFVSTRGITSIARTTQGEAQGLEIPLSAPIQPLMDMVNWNAIDVAAAGYFNNYLLFAVPMGSDTVNRSILVYDLLLNGGAGAWVSVWDGEFLTPARFFEQNERLWCLAHDGLIREFFCRGHRDTVNPFDDTPLFKAGELVEEGWHRKDGSAGEYQIYRALKRHTTSEDNHPRVVDSTYWVVEQDPHNLFQIDVAIHTRWYEHRDRTAPKRNSRAQVLIEHQNPSVSINLETPELHTLTSLFSAQTYSRTAYHLAGYAAWTASNTHLDWWTQGRDDYTVFIQTGGLYVGTTGVDVNAFQQHDFRFIPRLRDQMRWGLRITNTRGRLRLKHVLTKAVEGKTANRNVA